MKRVHLPVVAPTRRVVLRGLAATLLASLAGCGTDLRPTLGGDGLGDPDGTDSSGGAGGTMPSGGGETSPSGTPSSTPGQTPGETPGGTPAPSGTPSSGFAMCGGELCIDLKVEANSSLRQIDGARVIQIDSRKFLVVRTDAQTFVALSAICTHAGCTVSYAAGSRDVACPCHGSTFDLDGTVTNGPAFTPLDVFSARYDAASDIVTVTV